jgi:hypothetical protein
MHQTGIFTILAWIKLTDYTVTTYEPIIASCASASENGFWLEYGQATHKLDMDLSSTAGRIIISETAANAIVDNNWHHVAVAGNGTNVYFVIDGVQQTGSSTMGTKGSGNAAHQAYVGSEDSYAFFGGRIAELIMTDYRMLEAECQAVMKYGVRALAKQPRLYMPLWGLASPEPDLSGAGLNGVVTGATLADHNIPVARYVPTPMSRKHRAVFYTIAGITKDAEASVLGGCTVDLFRTSDKRFMETTTSDPTTGAFSFIDLPDKASTYFIRAYKDGTPNVFGASDRDLVGS